MTESWRIATSKLEASIAGNQSLQEDLVTG